MINVAIEEQLSAGVLEDLFEAYDVSTGILLTPARPFRLGAPLGPE